MVHAEAAALRADWAFPLKNGWRLDPGEAETVAVIRTVAAGGLSRDALARWFRSNSEPISEGGLARPGKQAAAALSLWRRDPTSPTSPRQRLARSTRSLSFLSVILHVG
jgi:hypothetical protein